MRFLRLALLTLLLLALRSHAQTTPVTATNVTLGGQPVNGYLYLTPVGTPSSYADGASVPYSTSNNVLGGTVPSQTFVGSLTNGALAAPLPVPDQCASSSLTPGSGLDYLVQVVNTYPRGSYSFRIPASTCYLSGASPIAIEGFRYAQAIAITPPGLSASTSLLNGGHCQQPAETTVFSGTAPNYTVTHYACGPDNLFHAITGTGGGSGTPGANGTNGSNFLQASGAPGNGTGNNGDSYLDIASGNVYLKAAGSWALTGSLKGPVGTPGSGASAIPSYTFANFPTTGPVANQTLIFQTDAVAGSVGTVGGGALRKLVLYLGSGVWGPADQLEKGIANGVASLDANGRILLSQLPSGTTSVVYGTTGNSATTSTATVPAGSICNVGTVSGTTLTVSGSNVFVQCLSGGTAISFSGGSLTSTTTSLSVSSTSPTQGTNVTLTATISPSSGPTGSVTFKDGSTTLGTVTISSGTASYTTSALSNGSHSITAVYSGDSSYTTSTSAATTVTVSSSGGGGGGPQASASNAYYSASNGGTQSIACTAGHTLLLFVNITAGSATPTLTTATGNTLTPLSFLTNTTQSGYTVSGWAVNSCNGTTGNYTYGGSSSPMLLTYLDISGATTSSPIDGTPVVCTNTGAAQPGCTSSTTTTGSSDLLLTAGFTKNATWTFGGTGYTNIWGTTNSSAGWYITGQPAGSYTIPNTYPGGSYPNTTIYFGVH